MALSISFDIQPDETIVVNGWNHPMFDKIVPPDYAELIDLVNSLNDQQIITAIVASMYYTGADGDDMTKFYKKIKHNVDAYIEDKEDYSTLSSMRVSVLTSIFSVSNYRLAIFLREAKYDNA